MNKTYIICPNCGKYMEQQGNTTTIPTGPASRPTSMEKTTLFLCRDCEIITNVKEKSLFMLLNVVKDNPEKNVQEHMLDTIQKTADRIKSISMKLADHDKKLQGVTFLDVLQLYYLLGILEGQIRKLKKEFPYRNII